MSQTLYRSTHKTNLQTILQAIVFENNNLLVNVGYSNSALTDPTIFITSNDINPNVKNNVVMDNQSYYRGYKYDITCAFVYSADGNNPDNTQEIRIDTLEELILNKLQSQSVAINNPNWYELIVVSISPAFNPDPNFEDNRIYKTFTVEIRDIINIFNLP